MSDEIDFDQLIELLDRALTSKDPKVISALKKFLFIAALATEDTEEEGPFRNLVRRIEALEASTAFRSSGGWFPNTGSPYYGNGTTTTWATSPSTHYYSGGSYTSMGDATSSTTTTASTQEMIDNAIKSLDQIAEEHLQNK